MAARPKREVKKQARLSELLDEKNGNKPEGESILNKYQTLCDIEVMCFFYSQKIADSVFITYTHSCIMIVMIEAKF